MSSYDQNLLDEAPKATRAQLQEGYNVDLLEQPPRRTPSVRNPPPQTPQPAPLTVPLTPGIAEIGSREKIGTPTHPPAPKSRTSFWRSRNGVIAVVVIVIVVIGAVVGGAVGGTVKKSSNNSVGTTGTNSTGSSASALPITQVPDSTSASATVSGSQGIAGGGTRPAGFTTTPTAVATSTGGQNINIQMGMQNTGKQTAAP